MILPTFAVFSIYYYYTIITTYRPRTHWIVTFLSSFQNDANLDIIKVTRSIVSNLNLNRLKEWCSQLAGGRQIYFAPFAVYIITTFLNKKTANSTDSNKVAPEKKTQKNMVILDYYKFLSANL